MQFNNGAYAGVPMDVTGGYNPNPYGNPQQQFYNGQVTQNPNARRPVDPRVYDTPEIVVDTNRKSMFTISDGSNNNATLKVDDLSDMERAKKSGDVSTRKKKKDSAPETGIVKVGSEKVSGTVENPSTIYTYQETNNLLHDTLGQIDAINVELVQEFNSVRNNRTMKNKYMVLNNLAENIGAMVSNRISTIKEINNCITKANDLDYKKYKDVQAAQSAMTDDKYIADIYQAFMQNPQNQAPSYTLPNIDQSIMGSGIIRANITDPNNKDALMDAGYLNYVSNLTPEQNLMRYESNPNVKQVVVYDASNGSRFFQMMDTSTGEVIPNVPVYDDIIMQDTTLDLANGIAKNLNIRETFPIVQINNSVTSQY